MPDEKVPDEKVQQLDTTPAAPRGNSRAYNLVVLAVAVTLLNVWIASTLPLWSHQIQRDKEAELIFRGLQYAEAIRLFQTRYDRLPTSLKELIDVEPRCIRQLYENPMRDDGRWGLVPQGVGGQVGTDATQPNPDGRGDLQSRNDPSGPGDDGGRPGLGQDPFGNEKNPDAGVLLSADPEDTLGQTPSTVQIRGVFHPGGEESIHLFLGKDNPREWLFTVDLFATLKPLQDLPAIQVPFSTWEIGKPFPPGVTPQVTQPSNQPQQQKQQNRNPAAGDVGTDDGTPLRPGTDDRGRAIIGGPSGSKPQGSNDN